MAEVAFALQDGSRVFVDIADRDTGGLVANLGTIEARQTFDDAVSGLGPVAETLLRQVRDLTQKPDEVTLEFGVTLKVEAGVLIAKTAGEGNFKVAVKWKHGDAKSG